MRFDELSGSQSGGFVGEPCHDGVETAGYEQVKQRFVCQSGSSSRICHTNINEVMTE